MSRLAQAFSAAKASGRKALVTYVCAGDPSLEATRALVPKLVAAGADIVELGVPFSDPLADGPTIQAASQRALAQGVTPARVLALVEQLRGDGIQAPIVLMGYLNPILAAGIGAFCARAARAGADGLIIPDLPLDEADELGRAAEATGLDLILLVAPTSPPERVQRIAERTRGFLYFVSVTGVTGARAELPADLPAKLDAARAVCRSPVAVGFGVSTPEQAGALAQHADGVVVGSAIIQALAASGGQLEPPVELVRRLAAALRP